MTFATLLEIIFVVTRVAGFHGSGLTRRILLRGHGVRRVAHRALPDLVELTLTSVRNRHMGIDGRGIRVNFDILGVERFKGTVAGEAILLGHFRCTRAIRGSHKESGESKGRTANVLGRGHGAGDVSKMGKKSRKVLKLVFPSKAENNHKKIKAFDGSSLEGTSATTRTLNAREKDTALAASRDEAPKNL